MKTVQEIRAAFMRVHDYAVHNSRSPYMSIPADPERDADLIVCAAIDELAQLREALTASEARAEKADKQWDFWKNCSDRLYEEKIALLDLLAAERARAEKAEAKNTEAACAYCGEAFKKDTPGGTILAHIVGCEKRQDVYEKELRASEDDLALERAKVARIREEILEEAIEAINAAFEMDEDIAPQDVLRSLARNRGTEDKEGPMHGLDGTACKLCGSRIGPDITGRPMCYGCGPRDMTPREARPTDPGSEGET